MLSQALVRETFDLLILDWNIPGKGGLAMLQWIQSSMPERPPVIIMTNRSAKKEISDALNAGVFAALPLDHETSIQLYDLLRQVRHAVGDFA